MGAGGDRTAARRALGQCARIPTPGRGSGKRGRGCRAASREEEQGWGAALEKRRSLRLLKTREAGAADKGRIVPGRERAGGAEPAEGAPGRGAGEGRGLGPAIRSRGLR